MRDNFYLVQRLNTIWQSYFADVKKTDQIHIHFGRRANFRFGSIRYCYSKKCVDITINGKFIEEKYPKEIIDHTIAHELVHYAQGFGTAVPSSTRYPHRGGVIDKELKARNLHYLVDFYKSWVKRYLNSL